MKILNKKTVGVILVVGALITLAFWELWGRENMGYIKVPVLTRSLEQHTVITKEHLTTKRVENPNEGVMSTDEMDYLIGMQTVQFIPKGEPLYRNYFKKSDFAIGGASGKYVLSIPESWLYSYPQTLRRGDRVYFYSEGKYITEAVVAYARSNGNQEVYSSTADRLEGTSPVSLIEAIVSEEQAELLLTMAESGKRFLILYSHN